MIKEAMPLTVEHEHQRDSTDRGSPPTAPSTPCRETVQVATKPVAIPKLAATSSEFSLVIPS